MPPGAAGGHNAGARAPRPGPGCAAPRHGAAGRRGLREPADRRPPAPAGARVDRTRDSRPSPHGLGVRAPPAPRRAARVAGCAPTPRAATRSRGGASEPGRMAACRSAGAAGGLTMPSAEGSAPGAHQEAPAACRACGKRPATTPCGARPPGASARAPHDPRAPRRQPGRAARGRAAGVRRRGGGGPRPDRGPRPGAEPLHASGAGSRHGVSPPRSRSAVSQQDGRSAAGAGPRPPGRGRLPPLHRRGQHTRCEGPGTARASHRAVRPARCDPGRMTASSTRLRSRPGAPNRAHASVRRTAGSRPPR